MRYVMTIALLLMLPSGADAQIARSAGRSAGRAALKGLTAETRAILRRDRVRDAASAVVRLREPRTVFRYTTVPVANAERKAGIKAGSHMTATASSGRPPLGETARARFGLPRIPTVRELIHLPRGAKVLLNKVIGGRPGTGELVAVRRVPPSAIKRVIRLATKR